MRLRSGLLVLFGLFRSTLAPYVHQGDSCPYGHTDSRPDCGAHLTDSGAHCVSYGSTYLCPYCSTNETSGMAVWLRGRILLH